MTTIFSEKCLAHEGDGKSKETAICFSKARTHLEAVKIIHRFLKESRMDVVGRQQIAGMESGFLYEIIPTNLGDVWFKTKMDWGSSSANVTTQTR